MQTQVGRLNTYHGAKRKLLGNNAGAAPPAWKMNQQAISKRTPPGSKILLSNLPMDVTEHEIDALFAKTIGPTKKVSLFYNQKGSSKGMALVEFHRTEDARMARLKYNKRVIDGRKDILIELVKDEDEPVGSRAHQPQQPPSLLDRLNGGAGKAGKAVAQSIPEGPHAPKAANGMTPIAARKQQQAAQKVQGLAPKPVAVSAPRKKLRVKKGPKRLKKTIEQLDQEMDDYRAHTDDPVAMKVG